MTPEKKWIGVWHVMAMIMVVSLWMYGIDNLLEYAINRSANTLLTIATALLIVGTTWGAYRLLRIIINFHPKKST